MIVGKAIYYLLTNATDVTDVVSTRVYPEIAQQDADLPYIVYAIANNEPTDTKPEPSKLDTAQVEVNIYSQSYTECIDLAVAVRAALDRVKGTYNGVNVQSIQYLNEVIDFDEPQRAYNINADYDVRISRSGFEIAQGSPITGVQLGELSDVDVTGVTNGQLIAYNDATGNWEAADDAGGANELSDLSDASVSLPSDGEVLIYSGGEFVNDNIAISNVTNLQSELDATPDSLDDLTDVKIVGAPQAGEALVYSSGFWQRGTAGASTLGDLTDVNTTGAGVGSLIQYNGASWDISAAELPSDAVYYHNRYASEAETLLDGATETVELYYTAQADGDGLHEDAQTDTAQSGYDIRRKLYYAEKAQADPNTSGDWTQFTAIADNTTYANAKAALLAYLKERTGGTVPISLKMTWEEVAEATLLLDTYTGAAAAYSLRKLRTAYTGDAINVWNGTSYADIGFDGSGELDTVALAAHCGSNDGFIRYWYDQSSNSNDAAQTTTANMPKIYDGTTGVVTENGKPAVDFDSGDLINTGLSISGDLDTFSVIAIDGADTRAILLSDIGGSTGSYFLQSQSGSTSTGVTSNAFSVSTYYQNGASQTFSTRGDAFTKLSGQQNLISTDGTVSIVGSIGIPYSGIAGYKSQEIILYNSDQSSNRANIEDNINTFYNIY